MPEFQPGRFGKYILLEKLATGGMAQLYKAKITGIQGFEKLIAIKMILPHLAKENELITSFIDEAKLAALLNHQNIVQIYDFGILEDSFFISMEYLFGNDLRATWNKAREKNLPLSLEYALYVISRVCSGLAYAHELKDFQGTSLNIVHRDISPQNIFVTYQGDVKILDFGIAKAASQSTVTQYGMIKGKVAYMSPEQAAGKSIDQRSDIFSTGILLYELVTNSKMFDGDSTIQILNKVRDAEYRRPQSVAGGLPAKVYGILERALAKEPEQRYQSCHEMLADMEECIVELALRPTARGLAQYMKTLFESEMAAEDQVVKLEEIIAERRPEASSEKPKVAPEPKAAPEPKTTPVPKLEKVLQPEPEKKVPEKSEDKQKKKAWPKYAAVVVVLVMVVMAAVIWQKGKPVSPEAKKAIPVAATPVAVKDADKAKAKALQDQASQITEKDPQKARSLLTEAIKLDPESVRAYFDLGMISMQLKDYQKAIGSYAKAAELDPQFPDIYFNLGFAYAMNKNYAKAEEMYSRVVKMRPRYLDEALFNLAVVQEKQGKKAECLSNLEQAQAINPKNDVVKKYLDRLKGSGKKSK